MYVYLGILNFSLDVNVNLSRYLVSHTVITTQKRPLNIHDNQNHVIVVDYCLKRKIQPVHR